MNTHCSHGVSFRDACPDCDRVWHDAMVRILHRDAARLGFRVVPLADDERVAKRGAAAVEPGGEAPKTQD